MKRQLFFLIVQQAICNEYSLLNAKNNEKLLICDYWTGLLKALGVETAAFCFNKLVELDQKERFYELLFGLVILFIDTKTKVYSPFKRPNKIELSVSKSDGKIVIKSF